MDGNNGKIIISVQAGFGNRMRALASGIVIAKKENKIPYYIWKDFEHKHLLNLRPFEDFFEPSIEKATKENVPEIDKIITEWLPGEGWYNLQSAGQKMWPDCKNITRFTNEYKENANNVLIETSLTFDVTEDEMITTFQEFFHPKHKYLDLLNKIPQLKIGISIRRGNLLEYFPEAIQDQSNIIDWISNNFKDSSVVIFSDDWQFRDEVKNKVKNITIYEPIFDNLEKWEIAFMELLILSYKVDTVYGTPKSSFCEIAALIGGKKHYHTILS